MNLGTFGTLVFVCVLGAYLGCFITLTIQGEKAELKHWLVPLVIGIVVASIIGIWLKKEEDNQCQ